MTLSNVLRLYRYLFPVFLLLGGILLPHSAVLADGPVVCSGPESVSNDLAPFSAFSHIAADTHGRLHLVWSSGVSEGRNEEQVETDTIYYTVFEQGYWSQPVDILTDGVYAAVDSIAATDNDTLIIAWRSQEGLYLSHAPLDGASSARGWFTTEILWGRTGSSDLFVDNDDRIHLVYAVHDPVSGQAYIGYSSSDDGGESWTRTVRFAHVDAREEINHNVKIYVTDTGIVHVVWSQSTRENDWFPVNIWYARSVDEGETWSEPVEVFPGPRASCPSISAGAEGRLYMTWIRAVGFVDSKYAKISTDGGLNWTDPRIMFEGYWGLNGRITVLVDSLENEYLVMGGDVHNVGTTGIWLSQRLSEDKWSIPSPLSGDLLDSEFAEAVIANGNQLHVVWNDFIEDDIYHVVCSLDAPDLPPKPIPTQVPANEQPTATPEPETAPDSFAQPSPSILTTAIPETASNVQAGLVPLVFAVLPVVLLVGLVVVWQLRAK
jgi:hypothetical protein